ncbi:RnfH family protein [Glaciecola sp. SC05]|uniref:RnfH family protein n=1 Tax=Glaciecola sp. SC05 TaxID=1987355 RepID=UPI003529877C
MPEQLSIEITYGLPHKQSLISLSIKPDTTVEQAIEQSGILQIYQDIDLTQNKVGIWNRTCKLQDIVKDGDRIEIYRPLIADPREIRKLRAQKAVDEGRANKVTGGRATQADSKSKNP